MGLLDGVVVVAVVVVVVLVLVLVVVVVVVVGKGDTGAYDFFPVAIDFDWQSRAKMTADQIERI